MEKLLEMQHISKSFDANQVLHDVQLTVGKGEVHALLGENGAGKSTLMNILTGVHTKDTGTIAFDGNVLENITIKSSENAGIAFVHQELNLFNDLRVFENIFLCKEITKFGKLCKKEMIAQSAQLFDKLGVNIDPNELVANLKTSQKQLLEISKALFFKAKLLILDEPTTALNNDEVKHLFDIINNLKSEGTSFIFISHKMPEIFEISDRYTVFRNGHYIGEGLIRETSPEQITKMMVGEKYSTEDVYKVRKYGETVLELKNFSGEGFSDINLSVKKGQVIGVTGLQGSGSSELLSCLFGETNATGGEMKLFGKTIKNLTIHKAMKAKIGLLAANRKENSVIQDMNLLENMYISEHTLSSKQQIIFGKKEMKKYLSLKDKLKVKAQNPTDSILSLSGGNQQKIFIARWLNTQADLLLFDNPTQGIDVGAKAEIYKLILELAAQGKTIIINTLEIPELQKVADECNVFYNGKIIKTLSHSEIDEKTVMMYSTNAVNATKAG
ncbi:MAG: sugar ABC transporter ATP-binding protein [Oscillospiraceae bacterium]|nr:sugar ABC transporter ATP-binding protein [Oscillospiraceae bacterium]